MAREIDLSKPLSADDIAYLKARHHQSYVDRLVELAGGAENAPEKPEDEAPADSTGEGESGPETGDEDLIGATTTDFDPGEHTVDEVQAHLKDASDAERARVLELERDGKGRSGILNS